MAIARQKLAPFILVASLLFNLTVFAQDIDIAIVGGTSFGHPPDFAKDMAAIERTFTVTTDSGESPPIYQMRYGDKSFYYIHMHGEENAPLMSPKAGTSCAPGPHFTNSA